jgi:hypothetical protein
MTGAYGRKSRIVRISSCGPHGSDTRSSSTDRFSGRLARPDATRPRDHTSVTQGPTFERDHTQ